jgi:hypothetical protein
VQVIDVARRVGGGALVAALDDMEVWQVAAALGAHTPTGDDRSGLPSPDELMRQRVLAAQGLAPEPEPQADPGLADAFARLQGLGLSG